MSRRQFIGGRRAGLLLSAAAALFVGLQVVVPIGAAGAAPTQAIKFSTSQFAGFAASYQMVAPAKKQGLNVQLVSIPDSADTVPALVSGQIDVAEVGWLALIELAAKGDPVVAVATSFNKGRTIIAKTGSNIHSVKGLAGKTVAYTIGSMVQVDLATELKQAGMSQSSVNSVNTPFTDEPTALAHGNLDAYFGSEPQSCQSQTDGTGYLVKYPYDVPYGPINGVVVTTKSYLNSHKALMKKFLKVYASTTKQLVSNKAKLSSVIGTMLSSSSPSITKCTLANLQLVYGLKGYERKANALAVAMKSVGIITKVPKVSSYVAPALINSVG